MGQDLHFLARDLQEKRAPILENIAREMRKLPQAKKEPLRTLFAELDKPGDDQIRLDYDDNANDIVDTINRALEKHGIQLVDDNEEHDGFVILNVVVTPTDKK